jgi:DNA-binding LytR/AlgR family response regulator
MEAAAALTRPVPSPGQRFIVIKSDKKIFRLDLEEISYFNSLGDFVKVVTRTGKVIITGETLKHIGDSLPDTHFVRVHKSYIVSIGSIRYIEGNHLMIGDTAIPIGLTYREDIKSIIFGNGK